MFFNFSKKELKLSYGITVCNEVEEINALLKTLIPLIDDNDEIIVLQDVTTRDPKVSAVLESFRSNIVVIEGKLDNDFSTFKNNLLAVATGDYLFQIDADEIPKETLIKNIKRFLRRKSRGDCFWVPRINFVNGYTAEHVKKWNWNIDKKNRINFPDYQSRIIKLNGRIMWKNKVHEVFTGFEKVCYLPAKNEDYCLIHIKQIERQEKQNNYYDQLAARQG